MDVQACWGVWRCRTGYRGRKVYQPARVQGKSTHHLQRSRRVLFANRNAAAEPRRHDTFPEHVVDVKKVRRAIIGRLDGVFRLGRLGQGSLRLIVDPRCRNRHKLFFRVSECGQLAAKDTARIDVYGVVEPGGFHDRGVAVDHHCPTTIAGRPVDAHREPELVRFSGGLPVKAEIPNTRGRPALVFRLHSRVGHHQVPTIKYIVAYQSVQELGRLLPERWGPQLQLRE